MVEMASDRTPAARNGAHTDRRARLGLCNTMTDLPIIGAGGASNSPSSAELIKDTTTQGFVQDVIEASRDVPVLVDFWAPWCGPCKQLTPLLEKVITAAKGAVKLVKMNIDENPAIAGQMGIQSIPAVFAFRDGRPVDGFMGALPESQIKKFIERIAGKDALAGSEAEIEAADAAREGGELQAAAEIYAAVLSEDRSNVQALAGLARCYTETADFEKAQQTLALAPNDKQNSAEIMGAQAALELALKSAQAGDSSEQEQKLAADPNNLQARFDLAMALNAKGDRQGAMDHLFAIVEHDREWEDDGARKQLVEFFEAWGPTDELTVMGRRRLSSLLFA